MVKVGGVATGYYGFKSSLNTDSDPRGPVDTKQ